MYFKSIIVISGVVVSIFSSVLSKKKEHVSPAVSVNPETTVSDVLYSMGESRPLHFIANPDTAAIRRGREIVFTGRTIGPDGKRTKKQSKHFVCTNCHNTVIEDPDITKSNPESRLKFAVKNNLKLLPGTTFYGIVNRVSWYNDDYAKKYGALVIPARDTLSNAIQVCATQCSQGRALSDWELNAVMSYFWSIQYKLKDLDFSENDYANLNAVLNMEEKEGTPGPKLIRMRFQQKSHATFVQPGDPKTLEYGKNGNPENGKLVYQYSCMSCHSEKGVTNFTFDYEKNTFRFLKKHLKSNNHFSVYYMTRTGTYSLPGYRPYMPNFTRERMSDNQIEDLVAYINQQAQ